jgi:DNA-binding beta-propeller fold protein YncE
MTKLRNNLVGNKTKITRLYRNKILGTVLLFSLLIVFAGTLNLVNAQETYYLVTKWPGGPTEGSGPGEFRAPDGIAVDNSGYVYVADRTNNRISKFTSEGVFVKNWGSAGSENGQFGYACGVAVDNEGYVYVTETNMRVQKFTSEGVFVTKWGSSGSENGQFYLPFGITVDDYGYVYVADAGNNRVQKFTNTGAYITKWGSSGSENGQFNWGLYGVAVDNEGYVYVTDANKVQKFTSEGVFVTKWGSSGSENGQFQIPAGIAVDNAGCVYVVDQNNQRVQKFTSEGVFVTKWDTLGLYNRPAGIAVDNVKDVYVTEIYQGNVQKFRLLNSPLAITTPADVVVEGNTIDGAIGVALGTPTASGGTSPYGIVNNAPSVFPVGLTTVTWTVTDDSGNTAIDTQRVTVQDTTAPTITAPSTLSVLVNEPKSSLTGTATDIVDSNPTLTNDAPITFPPGSTIVTWTSTDASGNTANAITIVTAKYSFSGFLPPINTDDSSIFKAGSTVPVKFQLKDSNGAFISTATATITYAKLTGSVLGSDVEAVSTAASTTGNLFRYDLTSNQYIFNLSTKGLAAGTYQITAKINDGTSYAVLISLK